MRRSQRGGSDMRISGIDAIAIDILLSRNFVRPRLTIQRQGAPLGRKCIARGGPLVHTLWPRSAMVCYVEE
jgi:hypothetical protein